MADAVTDARQSITLADQSGYEAGLMAALDAGYDVTSSGMTLDRFCGGGITSVNLASAAGQSVSSSEATVEPVSSR